MNTDPLDPRLAKLIDACPHATNTIISYDHTIHGVHGDVYCGLCGTKQPLPATWLHTPEWYKRNMWTT